MVRGLPSFFLIFIIFAVLQLFDGNSVQPFITDGRKAVLAKAEDTVYRIRGIIAF